MDSSKKVWVRLAALVALLVPAIALFAQDWPTYGGNNQRVGHNGAASTMGPGRSFLRWWRPNAADLVGQTFTIDNLILPVGPTTAQTAFTAGWTAPASVGAEAANPFIPGPYVNADPVANPHYRYTRTTASSTNVSQPHVPLVAADHRWADWTFDFNAFGDGLQRSYALYVWLPIGPTLEGINSFYQQRFFVYEVTYGNGQTWIDVVDTYAAGTGWVRLGGGGRATNQLFSYNGTTPIRIRLHNTIPRDGNGALSDTAGSTLVYADAALAVPDLGYYRASPIVSSFGAGGPLATHVVGALNHVSTGMREGSAVAVTKAQVHSMQYDSSTGVNNTRWTYEPLSESEDATHLDNTSAGVTVNPAWTPQLVPATFFGSNYHSAPITNDLGVATDVDYAPTLEDGTYEIWAWLPGSAGGVTFGQAVTYEIREGAATTQVTINQDTSRGWVRLGTRRFAHSFTATGDRLRVRVTNHSSSAADIGRFAYADSIRFVGGSNVAVHSTPVQAEVRIRLAPGGPLVDRSVTFVAADNGRIYALDTVGNGDGTTTCYWTYPSLPDRNNPAWTDPNQVVGEDGSGPVAEMPSGFDLSSALVQRINGEDYLYIGSKNGRVYCIEVAGRGDMNATLQIPGSTRRIWSFPDDYPGRRVPSTLGPIEGSVLYQETTPGNHTIFVPTTTGRIYALRALPPSPAFASRKATQARWQFPASNVRPPGAITGTPALAFGNVYYGTLRDSETSTGRFISLNADTGAFNWEFIGSASWGASPDLQRADDFAAGPVTIDSADMVGMPDTVVVANANRWITALNAATGAELWTTNELEGQVVGNLSFTWQTVFNNAGTLVPSPVVVVPVADGRIASLFAETLRTNIFGAPFRMAWGFDTSSGGLTAQVSVGRNWMYAADEAGYFYAFNDAPGVISPGTPPGNGVVPPNDPAGLPFREAQIRFVTKDTYERLRLQSGSAGHLTYAQATAAARQINRLGFEWGETIYAMVFNFPYSLDSNPVPPGVPPQVNYRFSTEGSSVRNITVTAKQFSSPGASPTSPTTGEVLDGYTITSFTIQGSGSTALPPGNALASFSISAQFSAGGRMQNVALNPANTRRPFAIANPLALVVRLAGSPVPPPDYHIAYTTDPDNVEAMTNGNPNISTTTKDESRLLSQVGTIAHGQQGTSLVWVVDRSLMTLLRGPGRGLDQVRAVRNDLGWQGGLGAVIKPIDAARYPNVEDLPVNFPNTSLDYPNLTREYVTLIKDKFGNVENPLYSGVSLNAPTAAGGGPVDPNNPLARLMPLTPVDIEVNVPKYQPANTTRALNSAGSLEPAGYLGRINFFVDSSGNGTLDQRGRREAFRSMLLGASVSVDERVVINTPTVDLGSLTQGAGYSPIAPAAAGSPFSPWSGPFQGFFKPFEVRNEGNVNLLNLRVAKATDTGGFGAPTPWGLFAPANHERSWLDTRFSLWSDIDETYALMFGTSNDVLLQKARVGDRSGSFLTTNPIRRENPFLDVDQGPVNPAGPEPAAPRVAVTVPIGTPVGTYVTTIRVIEDYDGNESMRIDANGNSLEPYSDPTFVLRFNAREGRLTNHFTTGASPMVHDGLVGNPNFLHKNAQPTGFRTLAGETVVAFTSTAAGYADPQPTDASLNDRWRIYVATLTGNAPGASPAQNPLRDLYGWNPNTGARWFRQAVGPFPNAAPDAVFASGAGESVLPDTVRYGAPAFPSLGRIDPLSGADLTNTYLAYLGQAEKQSSTGRTAETRILLNQVSVAADGTTNVTPAIPIVLPFDPNTSKGKPAIVQTGNNVTIFYGGGGTGSTTLFQTHYDGATFSQPQPLNLGRGFETVGAPSVGARTYVGQAQPDLPTNAPMIELTFAGKLRGRAHAEIYYARLRADSSLRVINVPGQRTSLLYQPRRLQERLTAGGEGSSFQAAGLIWNTSDPTNNPIVLQQRLGVAVTNLEIPNTRVTDPTTGIISFDTVLGGKAYLDPSMGSVRFAGTAPARNATILLSYTPKILRVSTSGGAAYSGPSTAFDNRLIGEFSYWANRTNATIAPADPVRTARYVFTYGRAAAGAGAASRPYMRTMRLGVQLPTAIHTQPNGNVTSIVVNGMSGSANSFYQVDPANGRVYFTAENENFLVNITYTGVDESTGNPTGPISADYVVSLVPERGEAPVQIEQAVNESQLFTFIDPFDSLAPAERRAGLIWMLWSSTRAGGPDIYFQAIAPRFTPVATGRG